MTTAANAIALVQQRLGWRSDKESAIIAALNEAAVELETGRSLPELLLYEDQTLSLTADVNYVALPTGFLKIYDDGWPYYTDADTGEVKRLVQGRWDDLQRRWYVDPDSNETDRYPQAFSIRQNRVYVAPTPSLAVDLTWTYFKSSTAIVTSADTNVWLNDAAGYYLLCAKAGIKLAGDLESRPDVLKNFQLMETTWERRVFARTIEQETDDEIVMGDGS